jgi:CheY-like chemotaxis protein
MLKVQSVAPATGMEIHVTDNAAQELHGLKVLVIDDSKTIRRTAETLLSKEGCEVYHRGRWLRRPGQDCRLPARHHLRRHHDAAPGRLPDLLADQAQQGLSARSR